MTENKLSPENAKKELGVLLEFYSIKPDNLGSVYDTLLDAFCKGSLEFKDNKAVQRLKNGDVLEYKQINGYAKIEMEKAGSSNFARMYALAGYLTGSPDSDIAKLEGTDLSITEAMAVSFLDA